MSVEFQKLIKDIKKKQFAPVYLLHGDEPFYIEKLADEIENSALEPADRSFNQNIFFGKDIAVGTLISAARGFPMMGGLQVIIVKEAQQMLGYDNKDNAKFFEQYFQNPQPSTLLVLCFNDPVDERKTWVKSLVNKGVIFSSKKMYDNKLPEWVVEYCHSNQLKISHKAVQLLIDFIGNDLSRMSSEIDKLMVNLKAGEEISAITIEKYVGISKEYNIFEFQKALIQKDVLKANTIANYFAKNQKQNPLPATLILVYGLFCKLLLAHISPDKSEKGIAQVLGVNPYFVKDYLLAIRNYSFAKTYEVIHYIKIAELHSKGIESGSNDEKSILNELIFKILH